MAQAENCTTLNKLVERRANGKKMIGFIFSFQEYWHPQIKLDENQRLIYSHRSQTQRTDWKPLSWTMMWLPWIRTTQVPRGLAQKHPTAAVQARPCWRLMQCNDKPTPGAATSSPPQDLYLSLLHAPNPSSTHCSITGPMIWGGRGVKSRLQNTPCVWSSAGPCQWFYPVLSLCNPCLAYCLALKEAQRQ